MLRLHEKKLITHKIDYYHNDNDIVNCDVISVLQ